MTTEMQEVITTSSSKGEETSPTEFSDKTKSLRSLESVLRSGKIGGENIAEDVSDTTEQVEILADLYSFWQAVAFNCMNMFGTGPFLSFPYALASTNPAGFHAIIGYGIAVFACVSDSFVWAELGSMWPHSGGSYVYLRELYGPDKWGRFMAFMFIWQFFISGPAEIASGFIAMSDYLSYITGTNDFWIKTPMSIAFLIVCFCMLYRKVDDVGKITIVLWVITVFAIVFTLISGFVNFDAENIEAPVGAYTNKARLFLGLAAATRFGIYDMTGYYDVCQMGGEVKDPRKTIPYSCVSTAATVGIVYIVIYLAIGGVMPYYGEDGFGERLENGEGVFIMADFCEKLFGRGMATFFTLIVIVTIFGSNFSMMCGFQYIPQAAAEDGYFFKVFAHRSEKHGGLADVSLFAVSFVSFIFCFFEFELVVNAMTTMLVLVQFLGQSVGLLYYRWITPYDQIKDTFKMPLYPLPCIIQLVLFLFIFVTTDNYLVAGDSPVLELAITFLFLGCIFFLLFSKVNKQWPFESEAMHDKNRSERPDNTSGAEEQSSDLPDKSSGYEEQSSKVSDVEYSR